jgi:acyl-CoA reductase-like NAD-dependent aldehyde dehydrogenase
VGHEGRLYIGGEWIAPSAGDGIDVIWPHTEEVIARAPAADPADVDRAVAARVRTGTFGVNQPYSMDPAAPFGGVRASGFGHELGREGLDEYLDITAISVAPAP